MTSFISWVGVDSHGPSSVYFAADSRVSWNETNRWDRGLKVFASRTHPLLLGYVGDALFPSHFLGQFKDIVEAVHPAAVPPRDDLMQLFVNSATRAHQAYPASLKSPTVLAIAARYGDGMQGHFQVGSARYRSGEWVGEWIQLPASSGVITQLGSGSESVKRWLARWSSSSQGGTSRSVFSAFCDALRSGEDARTGGLPQLVGLYRIGAGRSFGILYDDQLVVAGSPIDPTPLSGDLEWRNQWFERIDLRTGRRLDGAQPHHVPRGLGGDTVGHRKVAT